MRFTSMSIDWDAYAAQRRKTARGGVAWAGAPADELPTQVRMPSRQAVLLERRLHEQQQQRLLESVQRLEHHAEEVAAEATRVVLPILAAPVSARGGDGRSQRVTFDEGSGGVGVGGGAALLLRHARDAAALDDSLRVLHDAAEVHRRKADVLTAAATLNPMRARRDVELALQVAEERSRYGARSARELPALGPLGGAGGFENLRLVDGGLRKLRRLKEADPQTLEDRMTEAFDTLLPRPPHRPRKKSRSTTAAPAANEAPVKGSFPSAYGTLGSARTFGGPGRGIMPPLAQVSGAAVAQPPEGLQPMPRFMGAHGTRSGVGTW